ncbi:hypothetical protein CAPTEDRAFT_213762 [Capitella teleta]|uniref:THD domain-containing protein n=1 Tax=Capitella teleta TaxID=283909 RepID=R7U7U2_CAPTE|nr:hypothetical protein CAPTEDRAFT_213762 [Capitella teleta]|eukprot:ELU02226.1 hypothetical protein CAPTEDRAFT_213762 [Capitella teleta]
MSEGRGQKVTSVTCVLLCASCVLVLVVKSVHIGQAMEEMKKTSIHDQKSARSRRDVDSECISTEQANEGCRNRIRNIVSDIRRNLHQVSNLPSAHLTLSGHQAEGSGNALRWSSDSPIAHNRLGSLLSSSGETDIKIPISGVYLVYTQLTFNGLKPGRRYSSDPCSFTIERVRRGQDEDLAYGVSTQYKLGRTYSVSDSGADIRAYDSVHTSGVFILETEDILRVRLLHHCTGLGHHEKTFFGLTMVNHT